MLLAKLLLCPRCRCMMMSPWPEADMLRRNKGRIWPYQHHPNQQPSDDEALDCQAQHLGVRWPHSPLTPARVLRLLLASFRRSRRFGDPQNIGRVTYTGQNTNRAPRFVADFLLPLLLWRTSPPSLLFSVFATSELGESLAEVWCLDCNFAAHAT